MELHFIMGLKTHEEIEQSAKQSNGVEDINGG